jgi:hypothetical protein
MSVFSNPTAGKAESPQSKCSSSIFNLIIIAIFNCLYMNNSTITMKVQLESLTNKEQDTNTYGGKYGRYGTWGGGEGLRGKGR